MELRTSVDTYINAFLVIYDHYAALQAMMGRQGSMTQAYSPVSWYITYASRI